MSNEKFTLDQWNKIGGIVHNLNSLRADLFHKLGANNHTCEWIAEYSKLDKSLDNFTRKIIEIVSNENHGDKDLRKTLSSFFKDKE